MSFLARKGKWWMLFFEEFLAGCVSIFYCDFHSGPQSGYFYGSDSDKLYEWFEYYADNCCCGLEIQISESDLMDGILKSEIRGISTGGCAGGRSVMSISGGYDFFEKLLYSRGFNNYSLSDVF